jgi:iron(III)-enterobactin esterase
MELRREVLDGEYLRDVWLAPGPPEKPNTLCVFLDAELYLNGVQALPVLEALQKTGSIPPTTFVFVSHLDGAARHEDYIWNDRYSAFIERDVVAWAQERVPSTREDGHLIAGLSLSGLAAAHVALRRPDLFSRVLCQSGSFWWLADHPVAFPATRSRFWLSVGDEEAATDVTHPPSGLYQRISQIDGVHQAAHDLEAAGATVKLNVYSGGHATRPWRDELSVALRWLFGTTDNSWAWNAGERHG